MPIDTQGNPAGVKHPTQQLSVKAGTYEFRNSACIRSSNRKSWSWAHIDGFNMPEKLPELPSARHFFFDASLYAKFEIPEKVLGDLYRLDTLDPHPIDGFCPHCGRDSTFTYSPVYMTSRELETGWERVVRPTDEIRLKCVRSQYHFIDFIFRKQGSTVQKIGQYPSLADISNAELSGYRKILDKADANELYKAVGLAAHGAGVGSFVYLRRVFERLIDRRFREFQEKEGWDEEGFYRSRMEDKIKLLRDHLPDFLVQNREVYSILSVGIHSLEENECLDWFEIMKHSIIMILEDDKKKKEELEQRTRFSKAIKAFKPGPKDEGGDTSTDPDNG